MSAPPSRRRALAAAAAVLCLVVLGAPAALAQDAVADPRPGTPDATEDGGTADSAGTPGAAGFHGYTPPGVWPAGSDHGHGAPTGGVEAAAGRTAGSPFVVAGGVASLALATSLLAATLLRRRQEAASGWPPHAGTTGRPAPRRAPAAPAAPTTSTARPPGRAPGGPDGPRPRARPGVPGGPRRPRARRRAP